MEFVQLVFNFIGLLVERQYNQFYTTLQTCWFQILVLL